MSQPSRDDESSPAHVGLRTTQAADLNSATARPIVAQRIVAGSIFAEEIVGGSITPKDPAMARPIIADRLVAASITATARVAHVPHQ